MGVEVEVVSPGDGN